MEFSRTREEVARETWETHDSQPISALLTRLFFESSISEKKGWDITFSSILDSRKHLQDIYIQAERVDSLIIPSIFHETPKLQKICVKYGLTQALWDKSGNLLVYGAGVQVRNVDMVRQEHARYIFRASGSRRGSHLVENVAFIDRMYGMFYRNCRAVDDTYVTFLHALLAEYFGTWRLLSRLH